MTKKLAVTSCVAGLVFVLAGGFLFAAERVSWLGMALFALGMAGLLAGAMWLWRSVLSFFATIAVLTAVLISAVVQGPPLWLSAFGETRTDCVVLDERVVKGTRSASYTLHTVQCGDRRIEYRPYQTASEHIGDVGERTSLVFDRTGLLNALRPSDLTTTGLWALPAALAFGLLYTWFAATRSSTRSAREASVAGGQDFL
ncbi:hypothetical protein [Saccharothrix hoggarensis]|uniref:DUF3592 domain-containing protein n=1 Tax=Saccharothrix hoggarensis TaxID=913853 RepID=A0ABW3QUH9_9PSEU